MPETKKTKKRGMEDPAKKAEAAKKTEEALKETTQAPTEVEKEGKAPKKADTPDWYEDMKERTGRAADYVKCFEATAESVASTYSIKKLDQIQRASNKKLFDMSFLEEGTVKCHEKMMAEQYVAVI